MIDVRATLALFACLCAVPALADPAADFYKGSTVTMVVSTSAGGGYDTLARAIARHLGKHIPGHPTIVVRNMPGAGGIIATNYLYAAAPRDGSVLGLIQSNPPLEPLFGTKQAQFDPLKFNWLGTPSVETAMVLVWHTVPVNSVDDLRRRVTEMGASGANSTPAFYARLLNATLGTKMKVIPGLPGAERRVPRHGARRTRRLSERVLQRAVVDAADLAGGEESQGHCAIWAGEACSAGRRAVRARSGERIHRTSSSWKPPSRRSPWAGRC